MNQSKKFPKMSPSSNLNDFEQKIGFWKEFEEGIENEGHHQTPFTTVSSASEKKILAERNSDEPPLPNPSKTHFQETHSPFSMMHSIFDSSDTVPYDPVNNYTSPRPAFLRYNPNRRKEILLRMREDEESVVDLGISRDEEKTIEEDSVSESSSSSKFSFQVKETQGGDEVEEEASDAELDDFEEQQVEEKRSWCSRMVWKLVLIFGVFLFSHHFLYPINFSMDSLPNPLQEKVSTIDKSSFYRDLLKTHMGFSDLCLDVGYGMCGIEGPGFDLVALNDAVNEDLVMSDEAEEMEVAEEFDVDPISFFESLVHEMNSQREESREVISENETTEISSISDEALYGHFVSDESETQEASEGYDSTEGVQAPHFQSFSSLLQDEDDQAAEESGVSSFHGNLSRLKNGLEFDTKHAQMIFLSLGLLTITIRLISAVFKYFANHRKSYQSSVDEKTKLMSTKDSSFNPPSSTHCSNEQKTPFLISPPSPMLVPCSLLAKEKTNYPTVSAAEEFIAEGRDSYVNPLSSSYLSNELMGFYASRPPTVSLLGEFSIESSSAQDQSQLMKSERKSKAKIKSSPSSNKVHPYYAQQNQEKQEDTVAKSEEKKMEATPTPLRRSNRLRSRVSSPTP